MDVEGNADCLLAMAVSRRSSIQVTCVHLWVCMSICVCLCV